MKTDTMDTDDIENWVKEKRDARPNGKLAPYSELIKDLRAHGYNYADVADYLAQIKSVPVTPQGVRKHCIRAEQRAASQVRPTEHDSAAASTVEAARIEDKPAAAPRLIRDKPPGAPCVRGSGSASGRRYARRRR
jgi:hypothetical protein